MKMIGESNGIATTTTTNWSTREKLYLVSSVLVNGDQNWSLISEQLNKIREYEYKQNSQDSDESTEAPPSYSLSDCSKQYKTLMVSYGDAKKVYSALSKERLQELDDNLKRTSKEYDDLYKEIELILSGSMDSQLIESNKKPSEVNENLDRTDSAVDKTGGNQKGDIENLENTQPSQLKTQTIRKGSNTSTKPTKVIDNDFTLVREKRHSKTEAQKTDGDTIKDTDKFGSDDDLSDVNDDDDDRLNSHKSSSSNENIEYLTWKPDISSQNETSSMNVDDELNKSSSRKSTDSNKQQKIIDPLSSSFEKRSSIEWKPVIDNNDKPVAAKTAVDKVVPKIPSKLDASSRSLRVNSSSDRLKNSLSSSSLADQAAPAVVVVDESSTSNLTSEGIEKTEVKLECTEENTQKIQANDTMDVSSPAGTSEINQVDENNKKTTDGDKIELIFTPKITINEENKDETTNEIKNEATSSVPTERVSRVGRKPSQSRAKKPEVENPPRVRSLRNSERNKTQQIIPVVEDVNSDDGGKASTENQEVVSSSESILTTTDDAAAKNNIEITASTIRSIKNEPNENENNENDKIKDLNNKNENEVPRFEDEKAYKAWKKSITMVLSNITSHKHATVFMQPVREEIAPGYRNVVYRPMDLSTIKKNIENGSIKTTKEFQRDIMLMFTNAIMYNSSNHDVYKIGLEMYKEVMHTVEQLLDAQENITENKPMKFKETRNSTTSDKDNIEQDNNDVANLLSNKSINPQISASSDGLQKTATTEEMETASNSNSSISTAVNNSNKKRRVSTEQVKPTTKRRKR